MSKPLKTRRVSTPDRKGVFGQGVKALRVELYARVSTHDQKTLPMQLAVMRDYAKRRRWVVAVEVQDVGFVSLCEALDLTTPERQSARRDAGRAGMAKTEILVNISRYGPGPSSVKILRSTSPLETSSFLTRWPLSAAP